MVSILGVRRAGSQLHCDLGHGEKPCAGIRPGQAYLVVAGDLGLDTVCVLCWMWMFGDEGSGQ